jgi:aspartate aminotransferase
MAARRLKNVPESGTVKIANIVSKLRHEGADIVSFSMGEPDFPTPDNITQACVASLNDHFTHYTPSAGIPELRKAVAAKAREINGIPCTDANVLITPTKQAIFMAALAMIDEGDEVILPDPTWGTYEACVRLVGGVPKLVTLDESTEFRMTPEKVSEAISSRTRMIFINSPSPRRTSRASPTWRWTGTCGSSAMRCMKEWCSKASMSPSPRCRACSTGPSPSMACPRPTP